MLINFILLSFELYNSFDSLSSCGFIMTKYFVKAFCVKAFREFMILKNTDAKPVRKSFPSTFFRIYGCARFAELKKARENVNVRFYGSAHSAFSLQTALRRASNNAGVDRARI